jgi:hypothetical protein
MLSGDDSMRRRCLGRGSTDAYAGEDARLQNDEQTAAALAGGTRLRFWVKFHIPQAPQSERLYSTFNIADDIGPCNRARAILA